MSAHNIPRGTGLCPMYQGLMDSSGGIETITLKLKEDGLLCCLLVAFRQLQMQEISLPKFKIRVSFKGRLPMMSLYKVKEEFLSSPGGPVAKGTT